MHVQLNFHHETEICNNETFANYSIAIIIIQVSYNIENVIMHLLFIGKRDLERSIFGSSKVYNKVFTFDAINH
jgi:hypothetical protein